MAAKIHVTPKTLEVLESMCQREGLGASGIIKFGKRLGYKFSPVKTLKEGLSGYRHRPFTRGYLVHRKLWPVAIGMAKRNEIKSLRELMVMMQAHEKPIPASVHTAREAAHAAGKDDLPETTLPQVLQELSKAEVVKQ